jgi:methylmalonyl-CoA mutase N-terminal domain/subunit
MGGMVTAVEAGYPQKEIAESAYRFQQAVERGEQAIVGVNAFTQGGGEPAATLYIDESAGESQIAKLQALKRARDGAGVGRALAGIRAAAATSANLMPPIVEAVRAYATIGEMCDALREVWGEYEETPIV